MENDKLAAEVQRLRDLLEDIYEWNDVCDCESESGSWQSDELEKVFRDIGIELGKTDGK